ncbi:serine/threonine-protein kinase [Arthrobacter sp. PGP41]|uniref:serine/threonine-protein kinase n=1 Tax=Arthrobacter sp. PGP41 TaxID=2079227 RepID=UPI001F1CAA81|nr:serine/threonine-protein kinase [Arthrobacter sp. PGP41]
MTEETQTGMAGTVLGERYRVGQVIGDGGMGSVYRGTDVVLGREVALKVFRADVTDPEELRRQQAEARMLAGLNHPGLVTLFDTGTLLSGGREVPFLVMELVSGVDLRGHLASGPLPGAEVARLGAELAGALQYIHHRGVVHRDIKPANILLTRYTADSPLRPKLADFGIARMLDGARVTATNMVPGTAAYLSPEQASGEQVGPAADIYALGLVLLEALTGKVAFPGPPLEAAVARLSQDPDIPDALGPRWTPLLAAMTARDPRARPEASGVAAELGTAGDRGGLANAAGGATAATEALPQPTRVLPPLGPGNAPEPSGNPEPAGPAGTRGPRIPTLSGSEATNVTSWQRAPGAGIPEARAGIPEAPARGPSIAQRPWKKPGTLKGRRPWILAAVVVLVLVLAAFLLTSIQRPAPAPVETPQPVITGPLGEHFKELEESVTP